MTLWFSHNINSIQGQLSRKCEIFGANDFLNNGDYANLNLRKNIKNGVFDPNVPWRSPHRQLNVVSSYRKFNPL